MQQHVKNFMNNDFTPRRTLLSVMAAQHHFIITPLLKFYREHGLVVDHVHQVLQYTPQPCFQPFCDNVIHHRQQADDNPSQAIVGELHKLIGNSAYGRTLMQSEKFTNTSFGNRQKFNRQLRRHVFRDAENITDDLFEISCSKTRVYCDQPIQIGFFVYGYAKLRMLQFYYDFLQKYLIRNCFELILTDTDSLYIAFARQQWMEMVKARYRQEFLRLRDQWLVPEKLASNFQQLKRQRGLFKLEFEGTGVIALGPKLYIAYGPTETKRACKGVQKQHNSLRREEFLSVLLHHIPIQGINRSFLYKNGQMLTVEQHKTALSYFYCKRFVNDDGIHTEPLRL